MKIISKINGATWRIEAGGAIIGADALELDELIRSADFVRSGINNLVFDFSQASMIDSIGIEAINHAREQGLRVSILNSQGVVKDMLERAMFKKRLSSFVRIVKNERKSFPRKEVPLSIGLPVSC